MGERLDANHDWGEPLPQRIAIVRALPGLGDLLCVVPALRALRTALPTAHITLIGLPWAQQFVNRFNCYLDDWLEFPGYPGIPEVPIVPQRIVASLMQMQQQGFDLALQLHGNGSYINGFTLLLGASTSAGFFPADQACPDGGHFLPYPEQEPEVRRHLRLLEWLGVPLQGEHLEFPLFDADWAELATITAPYNLQPGNYVCIHPGASVSDRRWSCQHFARVADTLAGRGFPIVLTGTAAEIEMTQAVAEAMQHPVIDLAGKTSLGAIAALLKNAQLLVCNDTGVSHLAAALQTKSVVIFSNSDPHRWAPLDRDRHRIVAIPQLVQATKHTAYTLHPATPETVLAEALDLLQEDGATLLKGGMLLNVNPQGSHSTTSQEAATPISPMRPEFWQTLDRLLVVYPEATRADLQPALEVLYHALPQARLTLMACPESLQPPFPELEFHDAAIVFTTPAQSPYLFAYLCYLAGIPIRIGQSQEFGGGVLSHCIQPPLDPVSLPDYFLHLLKAVGLSACRTARPEARPETETNHLAHGALQSHGAIAPHHPVVTKSRMLN